MVSSRYKFARPDKGYQEPGRSRISFAIAADNIGPHDTASCTQLGVELPRTWMPHRSRVESEATIMQRRTFIATSAVAGLAAYALSAQTEPVKPGDIPKREFGKTGEKLTIISQAGGRFPLCSFEDAKAVTLRAYELGINYFDCAHNYWNGRSEEVYGAVLPPFRQHIFMTSKSSQRTRAGAEADLQKTLTSMKTDHLDLWQIHQVSSLAEVDQIFAPGGAIEAFEAAKKDGKTRFIGFTGHHDPSVHLEMLKRYDKYDSILMPLNPADPGYLSFEKTVLPVAVARGMAIQGMKSLANAGLLASDFRQGLSLLCPESAHSLPRARLHHHRPDRR